MIPDGLKKQTLKTKFISLSIKGEKARLHLLPSTMGVHGSTVGVHGSTMGVRWEYMGVRWEYMGVQWEYMGVQWEYDGSTGVRESRFFPLATTTIQTIEDIEEQKDAKAAWHQMRDNYWCLCETAVNYDMAICSLIMYYGTGWHVMNMCGIPAPYLYDDDVVVVVYDEVLALQFKLACQ